MKTSMTRLFICTFILLAMAFTTNAEAGGKKDKTQAMQRRMQQMQAQFDQEKAALTQENADLKSKTEALAKEAEDKVATEKKIAARTQAALTAKTAELESLKTKSTADNAALQQKITELQTKLMETNSTLSQTESEKKQLTAEKSNLNDQVAAKKSEILVCEERNAKIISIAKDVMNQYEKKALSTVDPFFGLTGIAIENNFEAKRDEIAAQRYSAKK